MSIALDLSTTTELDFIELHTLSRIALIREHLGLENDAAGIAAAAACLTAAHLERAYIERACDDED